MSQMKFTPGPWEIKKVQDVVFVAAKPFRGHPYFGVSTTVEIMSDEDYPTKFYDAALVSAAPELYEALWGLREAFRGQDICDCQGSPDCPITMAEKALAKARGEAS